MTGTDIRMGEPSRPLTYSERLKLTTLLKVQEPLTETAEHDEMLFRTVHQVYEMWFNLVLFELTDARDRMLAGETYHARYRLDRCRVIGQVLIHQFDVIDSLPPQDFLTFRDKYSPASGLQSAQYREVEFLSGLKDPEYVGRVVGLTPEELERLKRRLLEPTVWDGFLTAVRQAGFATDTEDQRSDTYLTIARDRERYGNLWALAEAMLEHDQAWMMWRARHVVMAERQIGTKPGTGGSAGAAYLRSRLPLRFYPELWEVRSLL
ncbi:MAG TPA: tryptophan 2,3-dioxygenase family protein [Micromonosporaceae bacterium]